MYKNSYRKRGSIQCVQRVELHVEGDMGGGGGETWSGGGGGGGWENVFAGVPLHGGDGGQRESVGGDSGGGRADSDGNGGAGELGVLGQLV